MFGFGKKKFLNMLGGDQRIPHDVLRAFTKADTARNEIESAGLKLSQCLYQNNKPTVNTKIKGGKAGSKKSCRTY